MEDQQSLSDRQKLVLSALQHLDAGRVTVGDVAERIGRSTRQVIRMHARYKELGAAAVIHGNAGKKPANALAEETAELIQCLAKTKYEDFNHAYLAYLLKHEEDVDVAESTVRRYLGKVGISPPTTREAPQHRRRRPRRSQAGELVQMDGSHHPWFGPEGPTFVFLAGIDDATNDADALFWETEDTEGLFRTLRRVIERNGGTPHAIYVDRDSVFNVNDTNRINADPFFDEAKRTQFGRALAELGIRMILARSPQGKGRIERLNKTAQGRIPSLARMLGATTFAEAPEVLALFMKHYRAQFIVPARDPNPAWLPLPDGTDLDDIFCFKFTRVVTRDFTLSLDGLTYQLSRPLPPHVRPGSRLTIQRHFGGLVKVVDGPLVLARFEPVHIPTPPHRPASNHPWRRSTNPPR